MTEADPRREDPFANAVITSSQGARYRLRRRIGRGTFAEVYLCIDQTKTRYACKIIPKENLVGSIRDNIVREVSILHEVHHDNVLSLHDFLETDDYLFLILPYMGGGELFEKIVAREYRFTEADAREVLIQIARGLDYLHSHGICHRDIKPENILCSEEEEHFRVVIADFGLSKFFGPGRLMTTSCGTLNYAAPEVLQNTGAYTEACDMWGYGVLAYVLLTGAFPFRENATTSIVDVILSGVYDQSILDARGISEQARRFLAKLLVVEPRARATAPQILQDPWLLGIDVPEVDLTASASLLSSLGRSIDGMS